MDSSSQGVVDTGSEPNALWSVLFTSSQEQLAPPSESESQHRTLPPSESQHQAQHGTEMLGKLLSENEPDMPCPAQEIISTGVAADKSSAGQHLLTRQVRTAEIADPISPVTETDAGITQSPTRALVPPPVMQTEPQPQHKQTLQAASPLAVSCRSGDQDADTSRSAITHVEPDAVVRSPAPPPSSLLQPSSLALNLLPSSELLDETHPPDPDGISDPASMGLEARAHAAAVAAAPQPQQASLPYEQQSEEVALEDCLEDELCDAEWGAPARDAAAAGDATQARQRADDDGGDGGDGGRRLKRLRRAQTPPLSAAAVTPGSASQPSSALKRKAGDIVDEGDAAATVAASGGGSVGGGEVRPTKALRNRVVVRSAVGDDFDDLEPLEGAAGTGSGSRKASDREGAGAGATTGGLEGAAGAGAAEAEREEEEPEADGEEEEGEEAGAAREEDPEVAKQRMLREAALRDRIGGRAVPDAPVRPMTDVLSRIMARQKSLVDRTRANDPVVLAQPAVPQTASAHQPQPAAPPTFNVRALMKSLAESKQPQTGIGRGGSAGAGGGSTAVVAATQCSGGAAAGRAAPGGPNGLGEEASQMDLDLRLYGSEMEHLDAPAVMTAEVSIRQHHRQQQTGEGGDAEKAEGRALMGGAENVRGAVTTTAAAAAGARAGGEAEGDVDVDGELVVVEEQVPPPAKSPFGTIRGLRPRDAAADGPTGLGLLYDTQALLYDDASQQQTQGGQEESKDSQKAAGCDRSKGRTATVIPLVDLAHRTPSIVLKPRSGSESDVIEGGSQGHAGLDLDLDLDLGEEDDLIVEPDPEPEPAAGDSKTPTHGQQQQTAVAATGTAAGGGGMMKDEKVHADGHRTTIKKEDEAEESDAEAVEDEDEEAAADEEEDLEEEEEEEGAAAGEGEEEADGERGEEEAAECGEGEEEDGEGEEEEEEEGLMYDVDEEFDSTDEEDVVEPEALHFEEEEAATAAGAGLTDDGGAGAGAGADADAAAHQGRQKLTDVLIAAAKKRRAEQLAAAKRRAAAERGAGAFFVDVEAELSDEEEGIAALDDLDDEYDGEDLDEGILASLLGSAKDSALDEVRRAELHALWEAERDSAAVKELLEAVRRGFRRSRRKNGLGGVEDDEEDLTDNDARRRRANLFASTIEDDDDAPIKVARGHGLDLDLAREDDEEDIEALPPPGSAAATQDGSQAAADSGGGGGAGNGNGNCSLPTLAARAGARFPLGRSAPGFGFSGTSISRILDPVEAKRLLRQQSQEAAAAAAARRHEDGAGDSSPGNPSDPSPLRAAAAAAARHSDDVVALLQRSASAAAGLSGPQELAGGAENAAAGAGGGVSAGHKFTLFGSDITNRAGGGGGGGPTERFQGGAGAATFLGRSAAPTNLRTSSNAAAGVNTRSYVFAADASNSTFPEKSKDASAAAEGDANAAQGCGGGPAPAPSFAALRSVIAQPRGGGGGEGSGGGALMGLLGLGSLGGAGGGRGSGATGKADGALAIDLKRKLVGGVNGMPASKRRL